MRFLPADIKAFIMRNTPLCFGVLLSCSVGLLFYDTTANTIERDAQGRFDNMARSVQNAINGRIKSYSDVLRGTASLFQTSTELTREQFHHYVEGLSLEKEFPGIEAINFARHVTDAERPAFEANMRKELEAISSGYPPFRITPPGRRPNYIVITYIEPIGAWSHRFGVDIAGRYFVPSHDKARDTGELQVTSTPVAFLSGTNRTGLSMRLPVYRPGMRAVNVEQRRAAYVGTVGIAFTVQKLVEGLLQQMPVEGVRLTLTDVGSPLDNARQGAAEPARVLSDSAATSDRPAPSMARRDGQTFVTTLPIGFNQRWCEAHFSIGNADLYTDFDACAPWLAMFAGFISTLLLFSLFHALSASRRTAVALAQSMTFELRTSQTQLQLSNEKLRRLGAHADIIKEDERKRIAREIHDDLGQNLLALRIEADLLSVRTGERHPRLHARARMMTSQIDATIKSIRKIINDLRPNVLDLGLNAAVEWQIAEFRRRTGIRCDLAATHQDIAVSDHCATALFRILQESLSNILRHAHATRVQVVLQYRDESISMSVGDDGIGVHATARHKPGSFGLVGIEERINILGGSFEVHSVHGSGTTIRVTVPMRGADQIPVLLGSPIDAFAQDTALV